MLQFILGRSGSGKTVWIKEKIASLLQTEQNNKIIFLVPEQQSFEMEHAMLDLLGPKDCRQVEVLSFSRLSDFVFRRRGGLSGKAIDDGGRAIIMSLAIEQAQDNLRLYKKQINKPELITLMLNAVKEFKMCAVSGDKLREAAALSGDETLKEKLSETALITDLYDAIICERYIDPLDNLTRLYKSISETPFFDGYTVFVDGFSGFTMQEQKILELIIKQADCLLVSVCGDTSEFSSENDLFFTTKRTMRMLSETAKKNGISILPRVELKKPRRFATQALSDLEESIFRPDAPPSTAVTEHTIKLYAADNVYDESNFIAQSIRKLTIEKNYMFRDIAVICRSADSYRGILDTVFDQYDISYFMDKPQEIGSKPLIMFVLSAFDAVHTYFSAESVLRLLKTGLAGFTAEETALLENYVFVWNISGGKWSEEFTMNPRGYADEFKKSDMEELGLVEQLRQRVMHPLLEFRERVLNTDGLRISKAVYRLLEVFCVSKTLKVTARQLERENRLNAAKEQERLWDVMIEALDQLSLILEGKYISSKRYSELLKLVLGSADISFIPNSLDEVTVGTADRIRLSSPKAVFVVGANEGEFPHMPVASGLFSDAERKRLISLSVPLYDGIEQLASQEKFLAYCAVSAPTERLYVSYNKASLSGETKSSSSIIREILRLYPGKKEICSSDIYWTDKLCAEAAAFELCIKHSAEDPIARKLILDFFMPLDRFKNTVKAVKRFADSTPITIHNNELSRRLFGGDKIKLSASQVEKFHLCPFQYFCRYGVRAMERKSAQIDSAEYGSFIHFLMEHMLRESTVAQLSALTEAQLQERLDFLTDEYLQTHFGGKNDKSRRYLYMLDRMKSSALMLITHMLRELSQSMFTPQAFELFLGEHGEIPPYELVIAENETVIIEGYIDRVDIMRQENTSYVRVVDYKTGAKKFVLSDVNFGLNLQMLIYLYAITHSGKNDTPVLPAGVLYMPSAAPVINADRKESAESIEDKRAKSYRMNGLILDDLSVIKAMDADGKGAYIPVTLKEEKPKKTTKTDSNAAETAVTLKVDKGKEYLVCDEEMKRIFRRIDELISGMAQKLLDGKISAVPAKGTYDACKWCPYAGACGYEDGMECVQVEENKTVFRNVPEHVGEENNA